MAYLHCTGPGLGAVQGTGQAQQETMGPGACPCLGLVWTFLHNILEPIDQVPGPIPVQCEHTTTLHSHLYDIPPPTHANVNTSRHFLHAPWVANVKLCSVQRRSVPKWAFHLSMSLMCTGKWWCIRMLHRIDNHSAQYFLYGPPLQWVKRCKRNLSVLLITKLLSRCPV